MARTTAALVGGIVDVDPTVSLIPFIDVANSMVTSVCATKTLADGVTPFYTTARLTLIETWLAAHFYCVRDPRTLKERISVISEQTQSKVDLGLSVTHYGQQAMILDEAGGLAALNNNTKSKKGTLRPGVKWVGTPAS